MTMASLFDPFFLAHRGLRKQIAAMAGTSTHGILLDVGCGATPYRSLFGDALYLGAEVPTASTYGSAKNADVFFDGLRLPIADASVDHILCSQVLEHVFEPKAFLHELHRVLKPGGRMLLTVPFVWDEHEQPYDFARYSSFGLRHLARSCGFEVVVANRTLGDASLFVQLWLSYLHKVLRRHKPLFAKPALATAAACLNLTGLVLGRLLPQSPDMYLDNAMVWVKREAP